MYKILLFLLIFVMPLFGQWTTGEDVSNSNGNYFAASNTDSVFWDDDTLYICGAETAYVFVGTRKTLGMLTYKGTISTKDTMSHSNDSSRVVFELAMLKGLSYTALDASVTETYYGMDSVDVAFGGADDIYFYPFQNTNLDQLHTLYYLLRIRGRFSTNLSKIWLKEERIRAF